MNKLEQLIESYPDAMFLKADGFDEAIIGVDPLNETLVYSIPKAMKILQENGMSEEQAYEYFDFNIHGAYVGEQTPIWIDTLEED